MFRDLENFMPLAILLGVVKKAISIISLKEYHNSNVHDLLFQFYQELEHSLNIFFWARDF